MPAGLGQGERGGCLGDEFQTTLIRTQVIRPGSASRRAPPESPTE
jgi:hypothetical protein